MADSSYIFNYLDDIWELLPDADRVRFAELWKAYEQTYGEVWIRMFERQMAANIDYLPLYNVRRWLKHEFSDGTKITRPATFRSRQDLSQGINLQNRYLIRFSVNDGPELEVDLRGLNPGSTRLFEIVNNINTVAGSQIAFAVENNQLLEFRSPTTGPTSTLSFYPTSSPANDASEIILGFDPAVDLPLTLPRFRYEYLLGDRFIVAIPELQSHIHDELVTSRLAEGVDYAVEFGTGVISFAVEPPEFMWAKDTLINQETPYNNYGYLLEIYDRNTESYLKAVKGLWYAFWTGPRPENIRRSLYLLFGLPTASQAGVVSNITDEQVTLTYDDGTTETFQVPTDLSPIVVFNQRVTRFEPLVSGIRVFDKVNYPGFVQREVGRFGVQPFLTEKATRGVSPDTDESRALRLLEENTYLPQIEVSTFVSPDIQLGNVRTFLSTLQPKSRSFLFQVLVGIFRDKLDLKDEGLTGTTSPDWPNGIPALGLAINFDATPNVDWNPNTEVDQDQLNEAEENDYTYMQLDEGFANADRVEVDVYEGVSLVDSFALEG